MIFDKIFLASDHAGVSYKQDLVDMLIDMSIEYEDLGPNSEESVHYPEYARKLINRMKDYSGNAAGVLICGSGIGMSMVANRHKGIRAALCHCTTAARLTRQHNNANILILGARLTGIEIGKDCLELFLKTPFEGGRHMIRCEMIDKESS